MNVKYELKFSDDKGINCDDCMLSTVKGETFRCIALGTRPTCPAEGKRKDCPLKIDN